MRGRWTGLRVIDGRLWFAPKRYLPARARLCFEPDALIVGKGSQHRPLAWDEGFPTHARRGEWAWWAYEDAAGGELDGLISSKVRVMRDQMASFLPARDGFGGTAGQEQWVISLGFGPRRFFAVSPIGVTALAHYLAHTPHARPGLADPDRLRRLLDELRAEDHVWSQPFGARFTGPASSLDHVVARVLDGTWPRRFCGYAVRGEPAPSHDELVEAITGALPAWLRTDVDDAKVRRALEGHTNRQVWPFDVLVDPR